tara:strand:- start:449 stop:838 length:390 start_codon:yes stop_codon:yes gene_type:complete
MEPFIAEKILTPAQRRKKALVFKKSLHKRLRTMRRYANKIPPKDVMMAKAQRAARRLVIKKKKLLPPELLALYPGQLTFPQKVALEKKLAKHSALVTKLTPKMYKVVLRQTKEKIKKNRQGPGETKGNE